MIDDCVNIRKFVTIAVVTNPVVLRFKNGNEGLFEVRQRLNKLGWKLPISIEVLDPVERAQIEAGGEVIITLLDLDPKWTRADKLEITHPATHDEVLEYGRKAIPLLQNAIRGALSES